MKKGTYFVFSCLLSLLSCFTHPEGFGLYAWWMYLVSNLVGLNLLVWIVGIIRERRTDRHLRSL
ncbi:hypothetical protein [Paenibacillus chitinolyticus]|uniref:hypothetical protein n=1 Tax=Paenibacillus chitinolyticus TaxID=79263 RepID=UPI00366C9942